MRTDARKDYETLVAVARRHLSSDGVLTSLESIAREAGVGVGTLYRHFPWSSPRSTPRARTCGRPPPGSAAPWRMPNSLSGVWPRWRTTSVHTRGFRTRSPGPGVRGGKSAVDHLPGDRRHHRPVPRRGAAARPRGGRGEPSAYGTQILSRRSKIRSGKYSASGCGFPS